MQQPVEKLIIVTNKLGLHARAAAKLVKLAAGFDSDIRINKAGQSADAKSIMAVMMLAAAEGSELKLVVDGSREHGADADDAELAAEAVARLFAERFGEDE